jgi:GntR family transcriptional regulator, transcriptional repressor for pyruvate dehydrogenase complex
VVARPGRSGWGNAGAEELKDRKVLGMNPMFEPIEKKRYFERIAEQIRDRIIRGNLADDFRLPAEQQLATELNVSRSVLREALRILDVMGYVTIKKGPQGGIFVSSQYHKPVSDSLMHLATNGQITVEHLFDVRLQIEPFIVEEAVRHARSSDMQKLSALFDDASAHLDDPAYLKQKNIEFHLLLAEASGNPVLSIMMKSIIDILNVIAFSFLEPAFEKEVFLGIHRKILEAVVQQKAAKARRLMKEDILLVKNNLERSLEGTKTSFIRT